MCGESFTSVFINANGNVSFGRPDLQFVENVPEFLGGPARIAGLWHDVSPFNLETGEPQGVVEYSASPSRMVIKWRRVPEFPDVGANSFAITLHRLFDLIEIHEGNISAQNHFIARLFGLAG